MVKFTEIPDKLNYPPKYRARLSTYHSDIITWAVDNYTDTNGFKTRITAVLNTISYYVVTGDTIPAEWSAEKPFENIEMVDNAECMRVLKNLYLHPREISWDIAAQETTVNTQIQGQKKVQQETTAVQPQQQPAQKPIVIDKKTAGEWVKREQVTETVLNDLSIKPPAVPRIDTGKEYKKINADGTVYVIYETLPEVPTKQNEISVSTDVDKMTDEDLMGLFPSRVMHTRNSTMYEEQQGLDYDEELGVLLPIGKFTKKQIKQNIVQYPHLYKLERLVDGEYINFANNIEIDGELYDTLEVWDSLPESKKIPKTSAFIREYVVRRYLLERDIKHIEHKYKMYGELNPFLTLCMPAENYTKYGYKEPVELARQCVKSRVAYLQSRNPILSKAER